MDGQLSIPACGVDAPHRRYRVAILAHSESKRWPGRMLRCQEDASEDGGSRTDNGGREESILSRRSREEEPGAAGMVDGVRESIHRTDSDSYNRTEWRSAELPILWGGEIQTSAARISGMHSAWENWPPEPGLDRVVDGIPNRLDRIKCLGNAVVPQQFYPFFKAIAEVENEDRT